MENKCRCLSCGHRFSMTLELSSRCPKCNSELVVEDNAEEIIEEDDVSKNSKSRKNQRVVNNKTYSTNVYSDGLFDSMGKLICITAIVLAILGCLVSIIVGIYYIVHASFWSGLLLGVLSLVGTWVSFLLMYGFGIIVDKHE